MPSDCARPQSKETIMAMNKRHDPIQLDLFERKGQMRIEVGVVARKYRYVRIGTTIIRIQIEGSGQRPGVFILYLVNALHQNRKTVDSGFLRVITPMEATNTGAICSYIVLMVIGTYSI